jgi:chemotaxis protein methyltransferase CheR
MLNTVESLNNSYLPRLSEFIAERIGLSFPEERRRDLIRDVQAASREFGFPDVEKCMEWLLSAPLTKQTVEILASHLTVGESYFFRDAKLFETFEEHVLHPLIDARRRQGRFLRIWSAGCASGEEAYSIAILLKKVIHDLEYWQSTILATDINPHFLRKARQGIYSEWSFRGTPVWIREKYFTRTPNGHWEILPDIKKMVDFAHQNLAEDLYPSHADNTNAMDIIFCRNVLMYFTPERANDVIHNFYDCLEHGGWLIVSPYEAPVTLFSEFKAVRLPNAILYRKGIPEALQFENRHGANALDTAKSPSRSKIEKPLYRHQKAAPVSPLTRSDNQKAPSPAETALKADGTEIADLARHYANMGMLPEAIEHCTRAISQEKLDPSLHYLLASILQEQGQVEEAVKSLKRVLYLDHNFVLAHFALGNLTGIQGKNKDAEKHFENALLLLNKFKKEDALPGPDGITAGELAEIITSMRRKKKNGQG